MLLSRIMAQVFGRQSASAEALIFPKLFSVKFVEGKLALY